MADVECTNVEKATDRHMQLAQIRFAGILHPTAV